MRIPLFDVDGTIIPTGSNQVHQQAFEHAIKEIYKIEIKYEIGRNAGRVDKQVLKLLLLEQKLSLNEIDSSLYKAIKAMEEYFTLNLDKVDIKLLPGVKELLVKLKEKGCPVGLLTGNIEPIGWSKMEKLGIRDLFDFGAFGNLAERRVDLIDVAVKRAEDIFGKKFNKTDFVIIGDTPRDIECAKLGGIQCIAVATGNFSLEELKKCGADLVVKSLEDSQVVLDFLTLDKY